MKRNHVGGPEHSGVVSVMEQEGWLGGNATWVEMKDGCECTLRTPSDAPNPGVKR